MDAFTSFLYPFQVLLKNDHEICQDFILRWHDSLIDDKSGMMEAHNAKEWYDLCLRLVCISLGMIGVQNGMITIYDDHI